VLDKVDKVVKNIAA